ncbi:PP2C family protein-serine/threonine phosphatase, partial [bacterium]|nr:PP2C family protein-serine/threonine phosphatase [bacterium]
FDFITKPIDLQDLETTINKSLREVRTLKDALRSRDQLVAIQRELNIAQEIQTSILPKTFPPFPERDDFEIYAKMITAKEVGGDLYDFFLIDEDRVGFLIGDVSGKGVPAAMLMAVSRTLLKATALKGLPSAKCLHEVNNILVDESLPQMFVTVFYGVLNTRNGQLEYCNGGHNPPYVISHDGQVKQVENIGGLFLGAVKDVPYEVKKMTLQPGDTLFLYTDGITEARNLNEEDFEEARLEACLMKTQSMPPKEVVAKVVETVEVFSEGVPQADDLTCLILGYVKSNAKSQRSS